MNMEYENTEEYLLLGFKENIDYKFFSKPNLFFKIVNLDAKNPFVQIGNHVFSGTFDNDFLGTNLLFEEQDDPPPLDIYDKETNFHLKYIAKTCKSLKLQWCKVPDEIVNIDASEMAHLEFRENYESVLKQLEDGSLDIKDIIKKPQAELTEVKRQPNTDAQPGPSSERQNLVEKSVPAEIKTEFQEEIESITEEESEVNEPARYKLLEDFVHKQLYEPEYYGSLEDWDTFKNDKDYKIFKEVYLKSFKYNNIKIKSKMGVYQPLDHFIDVKASIANGVIANKRIQQLDHRDMERLMSLENFDNFSEELKLMVLLDYLKEEKREMRNMTQIMLAQEDEYGRTPKKRYKYVKSLVNDLKYNMFYNKVKKSKKQ